MCGGWVFVRGIEFGVEVGRMSLEAAVVILFGVLSFGCVFVVGLAVAGLYYDKDKHRDDRD